MARRFPILPTLLVLTAVAIMLRLGFWQLDRLHQKEALLARYAGAESMSGEVPWPLDAKDAEAQLYRRSRIDCLSASEAAITSGRNARGESGMAHVVRCKLGNGGTAKVVLGWSRDLKEVSWKGGVVSGTIAPGPRLVADPPQAGLQANARPDASTIANNHLSYAVQWFLFAAIALVIYGLAVWKRMRG